MHQHFLLFFSACIMSTALSMVLPKNRVELFFKDAQDLRERIRFLKSHGIISFNIVNKNQKDTVNKWVQCIREEYPEANICAHYSLKYNKVARKGVEAHKECLKSFADKCQADEILVISGSGKKTAWNTIEGLKAISGEKVAVAYNPYFPEDSDQIAENSRLEQKLSSCDRVHKIYLQFGTDLNRLKEALEMISANGNLLICGSLFLPTAKLIAQQKFRPWNGVFLGKEFLVGPDNARSVVVEMIKLYRKYDVEILWEAPGIRTDKDIALMFELLEASIDGDKKESDQNEETSSETTSNKRRKLKLAMEPKPGIVLFGSHDVRLRDNRALETAARHHETIVPVFLWTKQNTWGVTGALEVVLKEALRSLESSLKKFGLVLICRNCEEDGSKDLVEIIKQTGAATVYWNREHTTESRALEQKRRSSIEASGARVHETQSSLLYDPESIELDSGFNGGHWGTLMPFLKNCKKTHGEPPRPTPHHETFRLMESTSGLSVWPDSVSVDGLNMAIIKGNDKWDVKIRERFPMTESDAMKSLETFFQRGVKKYENERSRADLDTATSKLSPHIRIGTISPNELYWRTEDSGLGYNQLKTFSRRLFWRELAYYQLKCFPGMRNLSIRSHYENMEWVTGEEEKRRFEAWKWGKTGYPIVDAGMRELYATGWMTQSVRMVVASFLTEYLRVSWIKGCEWFHYSLVDADSAINAMMWQNAGKSGTDQWNFVLSPVTASQDPTGTYTKKWVPELAELPTTALVHRPWEAPGEVLEKAGVNLGENYPHRVVIDLKAEREMSVQSTLVMRRNSQTFNSDGGYDLIQIPGGKMTVVFTKKEYRIDEAGNLLTEAKKAQPKRKMRSRKRR